MTHMERRGCPSFGSQVVHVPYMTAAATHRREEAFECRRASVTGVRSLASSSTARN